MPATAGSSKAHGKKRSMEEDDEATATDDEAPVPEIFSKKGKLNTNKPGGSTIRSLHLRPFIK